MASLSCDFTCLKNRKASALRKHEVAYISVGTVAAPRQFSMLQSNRTKVVLPGKQYGQVSDRLRLAAICTGRGWLQSLEVENERLQGELDALRQRAVSTPQHELRTKNERLTAQLREVEKSDKTRAQLGFEVAHLKQEMDKLRRSNGKNSTAALRRQVKVTALANTPM